MKRLLTAAVGLPLVLLATFRSPPLGFFVFGVLTLGLASVEFAGIAKAWAPRLPRLVLPPLVIGLAAFLALPEASRSFSAVGVFGVLIALSIGVSTLVLLAQTPLEQVPATIGTLAFGVPYFALPIASVCHLQRTDPWLVFLLLAINWLGDTAAYYVGSAWGKHRMAPVVSPKKTWEGAAAGLAIGIVATLVWSQARLGRVDVALLAVGVATAVAGQVGDLVESLFKRHAGVKDSGNLLPGHGGIFDRCDALLFGAPVLWYGLLAAEPWLSLGR